MQLEKKEEKKEIYNDDSVVQKIRKSAIIKRLRNFWDGEANVYPSSFRKIEIVLDENELEVKEETVDLTKKQFGEKE